MKRAPLAKAGRDLDTSYVLADGISAPSNFSTAREYRQRNCTSPYSVWNDKLPAPPRGVYGSNPGPIVPAAEEIWRALHLDKARATLQLNGSYQGRPAPPTINEVQRHLDGSITLAFSACRYDSALFASLDIDARFHDLLPVIRTIVAALGGESLSHAIFCTNGSDDGRGKIIITFAEPVAADAARKFILLLRRRVRGSEIARALLDTQLSAFPQKKSGGLVRILGRNAGRGGRVETPFSLDGEPGLSYLRPLAPTKLTEILAPLSVSVAPWAQRYIEMAWVRAEGTQAHFGHMVALAREASRVHGRFSNFAIYDAWIDCVKANSPELGRPSLRNGDTRNVLDHSRQRAWDYAMEHPLSWKPLSLHLRKGVPRGVVLVYRALLCFVNQKGLPRDCFAIDYERIAELLDTSKSTAYRWIERALEIGSHRNP
jgi:hypothetical protein